MDKRIELVFRTRLPSTCFEEIRVTRALPSGTLSQILDFYFAISCRLSQCVVNLFRQKWTLSVINWRPCVEVG